MSKRRTSKFIQLVDEIRACTVCAAHLPLGPRPVIQVHPSAQILIVGQAPGTAVHKSGIPFDDPSGDRLRSWLGIDKATFYDKQKLAIVPMGFCYPGKGKSGDLPPRPECADLWRDRLLAELPNIQLTVVIGRYALDWHLAPDKKSTLTDIVQSWENWWPRLIPLPHPSPRNRLWLKKNPWLEVEVVPQLQQRVQKILAGD
ncbi:MAG: uracil-DNA glycosylase family protein [Pseudomonadales bacterium]|nr:uracil-DNA glycosylase family protein [Pseudomonadales bacterium]